MKKKINCRNKYTSKYKNRNEKTSNKNNQKSSLIKLRVFYSCHSVGCSLSNGTFPPSLILLQKEYVIYYTILMTSWTFSLQIMEEPKEASVMFGNVFLAWKNSIRLRRKIVYSAKLSELSTAFLVRLSYALAHTSTWMLALNVICLVERTGEIESESFESNTYLSIFPHQALNIKTSRCIAHINIADTRQFHSIALVHYSSAFSHSLMSK